MDDGLRIQEYEDWMKPQVVALFAGEYGRDEALEAESERARAEQVTGVPTFMLGKWPIGGIQEESVMISLLGRWAAKRRRAEMA